MMKIRTKGLLMSMACGSKSDTAIRLRQMRHNESGFYAPDDFQVMADSATRKIPDIWKKNLVPADRRQNTVLTVGVEA